MWWQFRCFTLFNTSILQYFRQQTRDMAYFKQLFLLELIAGMGREHTNTPTKCLYCIRNAPRYQPQYLEIYLLMLFRYVLNNVLYYTYYLFISVYRYFCTMDYCSAMFWFYFILYLLNENICVDIVRRSSL